MVRHLGDLMKNLFIHQESAEQEDKYLPPNDEALTYIRSMPVYQEYSYPLDSLPEAGSYRLPVEFCAKHWLSLDNYFRSHLSSKRLYRYSADKSLELKRFISKKFPSFLIPMLKDLLAVAVR